MTNAADIAGYTYRADNYRPETLIDVMIGANELSPAARDMSVEDALDQHAAALAIDRYDEHSFDSSEFPKVIFWGQVDMAEDWEWLGEDKPEDLT